MSELQASQFPRKYGISLFLSAANNMSEDIDHFVRVDFHHFKAFRKFSINLRRFNILVGPNNAGKSTILIAFRILSSGLRRATTRNAEILQGPNGPAFGHRVDLSSIFVAEENLFYNYADDEAASVRFRLSSGKSLLLYFPEKETCHLIPDADGRHCKTASAFRSNFRCSIGFAPLLGPVDHRERLYEREAARLALFNYGAARNFRNIWHHFPEHFDQFQQLIKRTWPGMDVSLPEIDLSHDKPILHMWCPEERFPREIFWSGFGFQVWCQMLTHLIHSQNVSVFLIDEPDIYLHSDLQRQLIEILRSLGPDIIAATHSTEILTEADTDEIIVIDKLRIRASRLKNPTQLNSIFRMLGSSANPILTQLAKTRRVIFVEGLDFQLLSRFARRLGYERLANRSDFAVVPIEGFNPDRVKTLKKGMEATLGADIAAAVVLDRDYRSQKECDSITHTCAQYCSQVNIHKSKEIENFVLVPDAIDRAVIGRISDKVRRSGNKQNYEPVARILIDDFAQCKKSYVSSQYIAARRVYERSLGSNLHEASLNQEVIEDLDCRWLNSTTRTQMVPGKEALSYINNKLQEMYGINITANSIVDSMKIDEIPIELRCLLERLDEFVKSS